MNIDLSIVLPTCDRAGFLEKSLAAITNNTRCSHEVIVVDRASRDRTPIVLDEAAQTIGQRLRVIRLERDEGVVNAANQGLRAASGRNVAWLNDDARPLTAALDLAVQQIELAGEDVAFVALFHIWHSLKNVAYETVCRGRTYRLCHLRGTLYANAPLGRRGTWERLGYVDERFPVQTAAVDLSFKAWHAGLRILPAYGAMIDAAAQGDDDHHIDPNISPEDAAMLLAKWDLSPRNRSRNDFDPLHPCTLRGLRETVAQAA